HLREPDGHGGRGPRRRPDRLPQGGRAGRRANSPTDRGLILVPAEERTVMAFDVERAPADTPGVRPRPHFNNAGAALSPPPVLRPLKAHLTREAEVGGYEAQDAAEAQLQGTYQSIARLLHCSPDEVAFVENATRGWDMVFYAFQFKAGDRILTAVAEYASNYL